MQLPDDIRVDMDGSGAQTVWREQPDSVVKLGVVRACPAEPGRWMVYVAWARTWRFTHFSPLKTRDEAVQYLIRASEAGD